jgi:hypothetical protein
MPIFAVDKIDRFGYLVNGPTVLIFLFLAAGWAFKQSWPCAAAPSSVQLSLLIINI